MENVEITTGKQEKKLGGTSGKGFMPGVSGNPKGRPKGSFSIKEKVRQYLQEHPEEVEAIVKHFVTENRELMWQMLEGKPPQDTNVTGGVLPFLIKIVQDNQDNGNESDGTTGEDGKVL